MSSDKVSIFGQIKKLIHDGQRKVGFFIAQFCIILFIGVMAVMLMRGWLVKTSTNISKTQSEIVAYQQKFGALNQLRQNYQLIEKDLKSLYELLPKEESVGEIITMLDVLMDKQGMDGSIKIGSSSKGTLALIPLTLEVKASLDMLKTFFIELDKMPFVTEVKSISFGGGLNSNTSAAIAINIFIK